MFATVGIFKMDPKFGAEQRRELHDRIVPMVKQQEGFVSGHWNDDRVGHKSYVFLVWQTEASAERFAGFVRARSVAPNPFEVELESIAAVEIVAHEQSA